MNSSLKQVIKIAQYCEDMKHKYWLSPEEWLMLSNVLIIHNYIKNNYELYAYILQDNVTYKGLGKRLILKILKSRKEVNKYDNKQNH